MFPLTNGGALALGRAHAELTRPFFRRYFFRKKRNSCYRLHWPSADRERPYARAGRSVGGNGEDDACCYTNNICGLSAMTDSVDCARSTTAERGARTALGHRDRGARGPTAKRSRLEMAPQRLEKIESAPGNGSVSEAPRPQDMVHGRAVDRARLRQE